MVEIVETPDLRAHILEATRRLLVADGYAQLSMRKIARSVGVSATSLYLHFENKDDLVHALIDEGMAQLYVELQAAAARHPGDPVARLRVLCRCYLDFGRRQPEQYEIMFVLRPGPERRFPAQLYRRARRNLELIADTLADGAARAVFSVEHAYLAASTIWALLHGSVALMLSRRLDAGVDPDAFAEAVVQQVLRSLGVAELTTAGPA